MHRIASRLAVGRSRGLASSAFPEAATIWKDGKLIPWSDANVHVLSTAVQFGASLFEGIRCYSTPQGPAIVHLHGHLRRLIDSCKMYRIELPYDEDALGKACFDVVAANELGNSGCYIRPMVLRGYGAVGMDGTGSPIHTYVPAWHWGAYLGSETFATGIDCCTASWSRPAPNTFPGMGERACNDEFRPRVVRPVLTCRRPVARHRCRPRLFFTWTLASAACLHPSPTSSSQSCRQLQQRGAH